MSKVAEIQQTKLNVVLTNCK